MASFDLIGHMTDLATRTQTVASVSFSAQFTAFQDGEHVAVRSSPDCHSVLGGCWCCCAVVYPQRAKQRVRKLVPKLALTWWMGGTNHTVSSGRYVMWT